MDFAYGLFSDLFKDTALADLIAPTFFCIFMTSGFLFVAKRLGIRTFYLVNIAIAALMLSLAIDGTLVFKDASAVIWPLRILFLQGVLCLGCYLRNKRKLDTVSKYLSPAKGRLDYIKALDAIKSVNSKTLMRKQAKGIAKNEVYSLCQLGSLETAKRLLACSELEPEYQHFIRHNILFQAGDFAGSEEELTLADDASTAGTPALIRVQIELNKGVMLINGGDYHTADEQFGRAIRLAKKEGLKDKEVMCCLYENAALNKARLDEPDGGRASGMAVLGEYACFLDLGDPYDELALFNTKLLLLRQLNAGREELNAHVQHIFDANGLVTQLDTKEAFHVAVSAARVTWFNGLNPKNALTYLDAHIQDVDRLDPGDRLAALQEIANVVSCLGDDLLECYPDLMNRLDGYSLGDAEADLNKHSSILPEEAVLARCKCLRDRAAFASDPEQDIARQKRRVFKCLNEVVDLLAKNGLRFPEMEERIDLACKLLESPKTSMEEKAKDERLALNHIAIVEERLEGMTRHPFTSVLHVGLSWAYALLGMHDQAIGHYEAFKELRVPTIHYAPSVRQKELKAAFALRTYGFKAAILDICANPQFLDGQEADWFSSFESHTGFEEAAMLGAFLGVGDVVSVAGKPWFDSPSSVGAAHGFLPIPSLGLVFDVTSHGLENDPVVFAMISYPIGLPIHERVRVAEGMYDTPFPVVETQIDVKGLVTNEQSVYRDVYKRICLHVPRFVPEVQELQKLFDEVAGALPFPDSLG